MPDTTASAELWITAISEGLGEDVGGGDRQDASRDVGDPLARCDREAQIVEPASTDHRGGAAAEVLQGSLAIDGPGPLHLAHQGRSMLTALQDHTGPMWSSRLSSSTGRIVAPSHARFRRRLYRVADNFLAFWLGVVDRAVQAAPRTLRRLADR